MDIDFVIPWVDGSDPEWIEQFNKYCPKHKQIDIRNIRYRDYGTLKYWFRGVEKFAPWVRKVHFITNGQKPKWLNLEAPKLNFVKHSDYILSEFLPVFSVNPIEDYMHKIPGLTEHFVYFNDDLFLTNNVEKNFFFKNGLPLDCATLNLPRSNDFCHLLLNDMLEIDKHFYLYDSIKKDFFKWFSYKYGIENLKTIMLLPFRKFTRFYNLTNHHLSQPYLKNTFEIVWKNCEESLDRTMRQKFRSSEDVNAWLMRYWQIYSGKFYPRSNKDRKFFVLGFKGSLDTICNAIKNQKYKEICINDGEIENFDETMAKIIDAFDAILPEKSSFEI